MIENTSLLKDLQESIRALETKDNTNLALHNKLEKVEKENTRMYTENKSVETEVKEVKRKHSKEVTNFKDEIKSFEKATKYKEKENWHEQLVLQSVAFRQSTGNNVSGHYFHCYFIF